MVDLREEVGILLCDFKLKELQISKTLELYKFFGVAIDIILALIAFSGIGALISDEYGNKNFWAFVLLSVQCISIGKPYLHTESTVACLNEKCKQAQLLVLETKSLFTELTNMSTDVYTKKHMIELEKLEKKGLTVFNFESHIYVCQFCGYPNKWAQKEMQSWASITLNFRF